MRAGSVVAASFRGRLGDFELDVRFEAPYGGVTALFGPSGAGKTTILRLFAGLERLSGRLEVGGELWQTASEFRPTHRRSIGYVFQEPSLFPHLSVRGNLLYGFRRAGAPSDAAIGFDEVISLLGIEGLLARATGDLSGGERQRVAIGRALLAQPRLLLMDEPLAALDRRSREEILPYLETLHETLSVPILYVSHDVAEIERLADHLVLVEAGRVVASGPLMDILTETDLPIARGPDASVVVEASVRGFDREFALTELEVAGQRVLVPGRVADTGKPRRVRIAAADVSLATGRPSTTSILNVLEARIEAVAPVDEAQVNVVLRVGRPEASCRLLARISRRAHVTLALHAGQTVFAQVKAVSLIADRLGREP